MRLTIKALHKILSTHYDAMRVIQDTPGAGKDLYDWHRREADKFRELLLERYRELDAKPQPSQAVRDARNARWRHSGAQGSIHWALSSLSGLATLPTASDDAKQLAQQVVNDLHRLLELMKTRKDTKP